MEIVYDCDDERSRDAPDPASLVVFGTLPGTTTELRSTPLEVSFCGENRAAEAATKTGIAAVAAAAVALFAVGAFLARRRRKRITEFEPE